MTALYPDVPDAPGVPPVQRNPFAPVSPPPILMTADAGVSQTSQAPKWGIFDQNMNPVIVADSLLEFGYKGESKISDFPVEAGAFSSYNKVQSPFEAPVVMTMGGTAAERQTFLNAIEAAKQSLDLYNVVTPEKTYTNANLVRYDYQRTNTEGVTLLKVRLYFEEVRVAPDAQYTQTAVPGTGTTSPLVAPITNSAQPSGSSPFNTGTVQPANCPVALSSLPMYSPPALAGFPGFTPSPFS